MSNYTKTTNFAAKDSLPSGNANKIVKGTEIDTEFDNIATASATKANIASPTFTGTVTIPTVDLNGGAIDGTTVGASTAAAITGTTIVANTSINIAGDGATVTGIKDEDDMSSNSATKLATQQSIKAYVDSQVTAQDLDFQADSGGALSIDLDSETLTFTGGTGVDTSGSGNAVTFAIDSTVATLAGTQTLTNKTLTSPTLNTPTIGTSFTIGSATITEAELEILDGATVTTAELNVLDGITSTTAELNILDGVTSTAAELNILDGVTATTAEINYVDGVTSNVQTQLDAKAPIASPTFTGTVTADGLTVDTTTLVVDATNNRVGIGTTSPYGALTVDTANGILNIANGNTSGGTKIQAWGATPTNGYLAIEGYDKEYLRIDSSGNLLVGRTLAGSGTGFEANTAFGSYILSTSTAIAGVFDRLSTDGDIVQFRKDGSPVGSIGSIASNYLSIGTGDTGILFQDDNDFIEPCNVGTSAGRDNAISLGHSGGRFKDLYLSGRVIANGVTTSAHAWSSESNSTSSSAHLYFRNTNGFVGNISTSGTATAYNTSSDYRLKENVVAMTGATERLKQLKPSRFNFIADADTTVDGFLAHEVADIVPEAIAGEKDAMMDEEYEVTPAVYDDDGNVVTEAVMGTRSVPDYQGIDQSKLVPLLVATIQELETRITQLENN